MLHDHPRFQSQQALAIHNEATPPPPADSFVTTKALSFCSPGTRPDYRSVTIAVPMGPWTSEIVSQSAFVDTEDGMYVIFQAPMGSSGWSRWSVVKNEEEGKEGLVLREEATLSGYRFLMPFAVGQHKEAHKKYQLDFAKLLQDEEEAVGP